MITPEILKTAMEQSAIDNGCRPEDFTKSENIVVRRIPGEKTRKYITEPVSCNFISYGSNIVAAANEELEELAREYVNKFEYYHCFETPNLNWLTERLAPEYKVCFMAEYFLPDVNRLKALPCGYGVKILHQKNFGELYLPQWSNALCEKRKELDVLGVGAYDGGKLIGLAACSADCDTMWQIGVDVLPGYRKKGIASALTSTLALEIIKEGKVPFYCAAWSNIRSVRNAVRCGFLPAWAEMTVKPAEIVDDMNN